MRLYEQLKTEGKVDRFRNGIMFGKISNLYFVGIGGAGMSGIAEILQNLGFEVSGSDVSPGKVTDYLQSQGVTIHTSHRASNLEKVDVVVISSAVGEDNPEVIEARRQGIPVIKRAEMLGELMRLKYSIGVAGTHGKTTTTSMIGRILQQAMYRPTLIVGGIVSELGTGAALGEGEYLVAEADEYDKSFLAMFPTLAVVTNIEADHLDCYSDMRDLLDSFLQYMNRVPFYGSVIISADDPNLADLKSRLTRPFVTFGFNPEADYHASDITYVPGRTTFSVTAKGTPLGEIVLRMPGAFNVANAMAAVATCCELDVPFTTTVEALLGFTGVGRRFEIVGEVNDILVVDDYAHHPTEVRATLEAVRQMYDRRLIVVFQPHLFSRTRDFAADFAGALSLADKCLLTDIFPAREEPIEGVTSQIIMDEAKSAGIGDFKCVGLKKNAADEVAAIARPGDIVITMGAGSITQIRDELMRRLARK